MESGVFAEQPRNLPDQFHGIGDGAGGDQIKMMPVILRECQFIGAGVERFEIVQFHGFGGTVHKIDFLSRGVHRGHLEIRKGRGEGQRGESGSATDVAEIEFAFQKRCNTNAIISEKERETNCVEEIFIMRIYGR